ncbi:aldose 1-epimerase [Rhizobium sp. FY34]|uniref:aldose epimerase family protein n=1 Tax=Rhizobium sp. FY34 TaxID=2562309 RepID=UPI0010C13B14|nr:aldose 1-epimerase [Rhizobium sp. FY34]
MPSPDDGPDIEIRSGQFTAAFRPSAGGRVSRLWHDTLGEILVPMTDAVFDPYQWPKAGAYPLFPFHNRLTGGTIRHGGQSYQLCPHPALQPDVMHGPAQRRVWQVVDQSADGLSMALDYAADDDWPFAFRAEQHFQIEPDGLRIALSIANSGDRLMPAGLGWHPYFAASLNQPAGTDAQATFPLDDLNVPTGAPAVARRPGPLPQKTGYTIHLTEWTRAGVMTDGGAQVTIAADAALAHLAVHRMEHYLCLEPVSHRAGSLHTSAMNLTPDDIAMLQPGEILTGHIHLSLSPG